jgi:AcrR family transcriptional regulator
MNRTSVALSYGGTMARTRQPARERLLRAADELFYANGITGTGVDAVIARAGVATGSLYKNFSGKADLVAAYLTERDRRFQALWESHIESEIDPRARLLAIFTAQEAWTSETGAVRGCAHVAAATQLPREHLGFAIAVAHKQRVTARLAELAQAASAPEPERLAQDLAMIYDGMLNAQAIGIDPRPVDRARRLAERVIDAG